MTNILQFPTNDRIVTKDDVYDRINEVKNTHIDETLELVIPMLLNQFMLLGFDLDYMNNAKDIALIVEAIKSMLSKYYGMEHSIQDIIDKLVTEDESQGFIIPNNLRILKKIDRKKEVKSN